MLKKKNGRKPAVLQTTFVFRDLGEEEKKKVLEIQAKKVSRRIKRYESAGAIPQELLDTVISR